MGKRIKIVVFSLGLCLIVGGLIWLRVRLRVEGTSQAARHEHDIFPHVRINQIARDITGADDSAIRGLIDAVFRASRPYVVPERIMRPFEERLIRSEISYRRGRSAGVTEESVVRVIDQLALRFVAPEFARTSQDEVRELRLGLSELTIFSSSAGKSTITSPSS
jgi:hypothetical protein